MESIHRVCRTDVLIDLNEDSLSFHVDSKKVGAVPDYYKSEMYFNNKESDVFDCPAEVLVDVLGASDLCLKQHFASDNTKFDCKQENLNGCKSGIQECPTALLVDVPSTSNLCLKQPFETDNSELEYKEEKLYGCKNGVQDINNIGCKKVDASSCSEEDFIGYSPQSNVANDKLEIQRLRLRTPSPKTMSRISKEASKVIHILNSSEIFDEDSLLAEETFPIPINFETLDLEDSAELESMSETENNYKNEIFNSSVIVQTENVVIINEKEIEVENQADIPGPEVFTACKKLQDSPNKLSLEMVISESSRKSDCNSTDLFSSKSQSDSLSNSAFSTINDGIDDVFIVRQFSSEDKENVPRRKHKFLSDEIKNKSESPCKVSLKSKTMSNFRGTLKNLSNITHEIKNSTKSSSPNTNKNVITPCRKVSMTETKFIHPSAIKDQSSKQFLSSVRKPCLSAKNPSSSSDSSSKSSSSDLKQLTVSAKIKTPSKRYSMSTPLKSMSTIKPPVTPLRSMSAIKPPVTPLKSMSAIKPPMTPLKSMSAIKPPMTPLKSMSAIKPPMTPLHSFQNPPSLKYTPQSTGNSRFSFSKSWQQPTVSSHFTNSKTMKQQNNSSICGPTNTSKINTGKLNSCGQRRQSFSKSMTAVSFQTLGKETLPLFNKNKFCSKLNLPSPLPIGQDKKIVRVLFPSVTKN